MQWLGFKNAKEYIPYVPVASSDTKIKQFTLIWLICMFLTVCVFTGGFRQYVYTKLFPIVNYNVLQYIYMMIDSS